MDGIEKMSCEYKVVFYQRSNGSEPAREFIDSLSPKMTAKMIRTNGFIKKTRKTPDNELNLAKKYRDNFLLGVDIND